LVHAQIVFFAAHLARCYGCSHIIEIGQAAHLAALRPEFETLTINPDNLSTLNVSLLRRAVIVCANGIGSVSQPESLLKTLCRWLDDAPVALLVTPERSLNPNGGRWTEDEFKALIQTAGLRLEFSGLAPGETGQKNSMIAVLANNQRPPIEPAPADFRVVAFVRVYNEADIVEPSLRYLDQQGIGAYVIDNWSSDGTYEMAQSMIDQGTVALERFPPSGPSKLYELKRLLERIEQLSQTLDADWFILHDVDECREAPWPDVTLRDAMYHVDRCGFSSINHTTLNFYPVDAGFPPGTDFSAYFTHYEFGHRLGHLLRINAWKNTDQKVALLPSGGHHVQFKGERLYPYRFLMRHYPLRLPEQAIRKIDDRQNRVPRLARLLGWHHTYDAYDPEDTHLFDNLCNWANTELQTFDPETFYQTYLIERLSSVGLQPLASHNRRSPLLRPLVPVLRTARGTLRRWLI
jgi:hypothetical protein